MEFLEPKKRQIIKHEGSETPRRAARKPEKARKSEGQGIDPRRKKRPKKANNVVNCDHLKKAAGKITLPATDPGDRKRAGRLL